MSELLRRLHQDHANSLRLLTMLDWQIEVMERGERPDWDIVQGVIQYFLTYPDLRHHPLEDQILARLCSRHPAAAEPFIDLEVEHRALSAKLRHVAATTEALLQDVAMMKAVYLDLLRDFVAAQRDHIRREEAGFPSTARQSGCSGLAGAGGSSTGGRRSPGRPLGSPVSGLALAAGSVGYGRPPGPQRRQRRRALGGAPKP